MQHFATLLGALGRVAAFDYPYQLAGRRSPDRQPVLVRAHRDALNGALAAHGRPVVLIGKSMGGRIGCHVANEAEAGPDALVCLGYPLVAPSGAVRDRVLLELATPVLFVQGSRDKLCPLDRLEAVRARMSAPNRLFTVADGDHSLLLTQSALRARGATQAGVDAEIVAAIREFVTAVTG